MAATFRFAWISLFSVLSGCAGLPRPPSSDGISVDRITTKVQCEMAEAYIKLSPADQAFLDKYAAGVKLELKVKEQNTLGASLKLVVPVFPLEVSSLTFSGGPSLDDTSYRYTTLNFSAPLKSIRAAFFDRNGHLGAQCNGETGFSPASRSFGLGQWITESIIALNKRGNAVELTDMSYLLEFVLVREANGSIDFVNTRLVPAGVAGDFKRSRDNSLTVSFTTIPAPAGPQKIIIVDYPGAPAKPGTRQKAPQFQPKSDHPAVGPKPGEIQGLSPEVKQRLDYLNNQSKFNSVISPNSQIVPY